MVDLTVVSEEPLDLERPLRVRLYSNAPRDLASGLGGVDSVEEDHLVLDLSDRLVLSRGAPDSPPRPSFVIDYETAPVAALRDSVVEQYSANPTNDQLVAFVRATVEPTHGRGLDIASRVATHKTGDCTEFAVLLAALARSVGLPTRIVVGTVIVRDLRHVGAYGHAWTEIHRDGAWELVDATPIGADAPVSYVPEGLLEDEGPGYQFGFGSLLASGILRVEVLGNAPSGSDPIRRSENES